MYLVLGKRLHVPVVTAAALAEQTLPLFLLLLLDFAHCRRRSLRVRIGVPLGVRGLDVRRDALRRLERGRALCATVQAARQGLL